MKDTCRVQLRPWIKDDTIDVKNIFTVIQMVRKDRTGTNTLERVVLRGSVNDIFATKVNHMPPNRILLLAAAGKGKTTTVAKLAYDWAHRVEESPLRDLPLLFVLKLRNVDTKTSIGQAIKSELLYNEELSPKELEQFLKKNPKHCHIILDGLDEYSGSVAKNAEITSNVVSIMQNKELPSCRVLVTARPHIEADFDHGNLPRIYAKMEIEGFSRQNSRDYINNFFGETKEGEKLKAYLDKTEVINELVTIPFFCLMVCHLWQKHLLAGITTQTGLFDNINSFLKLHVESKSDPPTVIPEEQFQKTIYELGKVALAGLLGDKNKLVFTPDDFQRVPDVMREGCDLGIISRKTAYGSPVNPGERATKTCIEFYHKLAQEHSAGKYLAKEGNKMLSIVRRSEPNAVFKKIKNRIADYENLLRFAAGTNDKICLSVMKTILNSENLPDSEKYRMLLDCASESSNLNEKSQNIVNNCINKYTVYLTNPTVYTVIGLNKLPDKMKLTVSLCTSGVGGGGVGRERVTCTQVCYPPASTHL